MSQQQSMLNDGSHIRFKQREQQKLHAMIVSKNHTM